MDTNALLLKLRAQEDLAPAEVEFLLHQSLAEADLVALAQQSEASQEQQDRAWTLALGDHISVHYSLRQKKFYQSKKNNGELVEAELEFQWPDNLRKEIAMMESLELDEELHLGASRGFANQFVIEEQSFPKLSTDLMDQSFIAKRRNSFSFMKSAMFSTVLFAVLSTVAMDVEGASLKKSSPGEGIKQVQQLDNNPNLQKHEIAVLDAEISKMKSSLNYLLGQLDPEKDTSNLQKLGEILHLPLQDSTDLSSPKVKQAFDLLSAEEKGDAVLVIGEIQERMVRKVFYHNEVENTFAGFESNLQMLLEKGAELHQDQQVETVQEIKLDNKVQKLRQQAGLSLEAKNQEYQAVKSVADSFRKAQVTFRVR